MQPTCLTCGSEVEEGATGSKRPTWRAKLSHFEAWQKARVKAAGNDRLMEFSRKYM